MNEAPSRLHANVAGSDAEKEIVAPDVATVPAGAPEREVVGGVLSIVQVAVAITPMLPAASTARAPKEWLPSARPEYERGEAQAEKAPPSIRHWNVEPGSEAEKANVADVDVTVPLGPDVIVVVGPTVSTVNERVAGEGSALPIASTARTANEWAPSARDRVTGDEQPAKAPPSTLHWKLDPGSVEVNVNVGVGSLEVDPWAGPPVIVVSGGDASTVQEREAVGPTLPAVSVARTSNVCPPSESPEYETPEEQAENPAPSRRHSNDAVSDAVKENALPSGPVVPDGPDVIVVVGAVTSIVQACPTVGP
ncbi:MAG: hypothetical protein OEW31_10930, partial [Thermoleophilia bacterium]|nr:hypothetical protein [Thermoleophilia bacterium]